MTENVDRHAVEILGLRFYRDATRDIGWASVWIRHKRKTPVFVDPAPPNINSLLSQSVPPWESLAQ